MNNPYVSYPHIPAVTGGKTLSKTFTCGTLHLGSGCEGLSDYVSPPTRKQWLEFPQLITDGSSAQIFNGFKIKKGVMAKLEKLAITTAQLCARQDFFKHGDLVLIKAIIEGQMKFFVAHIYTHIIRPFDVEIYKLDDDNVFWSAGHQHRVIVAKQVKSSAH